MKKIKIRVGNLHKTFREEEVLKGITCDFEAGKTHAIVGNNGSGKSVLFKCICGFIKPTEGTITIDDKVIGKDVDFPESMGIAQAIMENPDLLILDEPFNGLDKKGVEEIRSLIMDLKKEGKTILLTSHNSEDICVLADVVWEMDGGCLIH